MNSEEKNSWFTYILRCSDNTYYTGSTNDVEKRVATHNKKRGAKYTTARLPVTLLHVEKFSTKSEAMKREYTIKQLSRESKIALIEQKNHLVD